MDTIRFTGRVLPKRVVDLDVTFPQMEWDVSETGATYKILLKLIISKSLVYLDVLTPTYAEAHFDIYYVYAIRLLQTAIGMVSFSTGIALTIVLEKAVKPNGTITTLLIHDPRLAPLCKSFKPTENDTDAFAKLFNIVFSDPNIMMAMHDLAESIRVPDVGIVNCARVMDRIKHSLSPTDTISDADKWEFMRETLNLSEPYIKEVTSTSRSPRHGRVSYIDGTQTNKVLSRSWIIMDRFLEYRKRGSIKLPIADFPLLT